MQVGDALLELDSLCSEHEEAEAAVSIESETANSALGSVEGATGTNAAVPPKGKPHSSSSEQQASLRLLCSIATGMILVLKTDVALKSSKHSHALLQSDLAGLQHMINRTRMSAESVSSGIASSAPPGEPGRSESS